MGKQFKHINMEAADFILEKTDGAYISLVVKTIVLHYKTLKPLVTIQGETLKPDMTSSHYFDKNQIVYEYSLPLDEVYYNFYPAFLEPETQDLPHEWVWRLYYEETFYK